MTLWHIISALDVIMTHYLLFKIQKTWIRFHKLKR